MGATQSELKEDVAEYLFQRLSQLKDNFVLVSNYLQKHNERCDVLATHLVNCESWMRKMKDDVLRREVINVRAELLEEKYTRKMDLQKLEEAEENINLMLLFFEKFGLKLSTSGKDLKNVDANLIASVEQGAKDRRTVDLLKQKALLQDQLAEKSDELKRTQELMKVEAKESSSKKDEEYHLLLRKQTATINDLRSQILKLSEENSKLLSEQLVQTTEKEKSRSRKKDKKQAEEKKPQECEIEETKANASSRSSSQPRARGNQVQQQTSDDKGGGEGIVSQQEWRGGYFGNRGNRGRRNYPNQGGRGGGNYQQNPNTNYGRGHYDGNQRRGLLNNPRPYQRGPGGERVSNPVKDLSPEALLSLVQEQQSIINGFHSQNLKFHEENANYGRGNYHYDGNQRRGFRPFQRGGPVGERMQASNTGKELSPEALLSLIKEQQATINEFHSQNLKLHEDNTKLVANQMAQDIVRKEKKKGNKRKEQDTENKEESGEKNTTEDKQDRIFACDVCGQISSDLYSLQIHAAFCGTDVQ